MIEQKEIKQTIKKWFKEFTNKNIIDNDNFVKNGYIDSFKFLNLIMFLEKSYDLEINSSCSIYCRFLISNFIVIYFKHKP